MSKIEINQEAVAAIEAKIDAIIASVSSKDTTMSSVLDEMLQMLREVPSSILPEEELKFIERNLKSMKQKEGDKRPNFTARLMIKKSLSSLKKQLKQYR